MSKRKIDCSPRANDDLSVRIKKLSGSSDLWRVEDKCKDFNSVKSSKMKKKVISNDMIVQDSWNNGDLCWAALGGYRFWPALVENAPNHDFFMEGMNVLIVIRKCNFICFNVSIILLEGRIHVKFLHDNGRRSWINLKNRVIPFNGLADFEKKCEVNKIFYKNLLISVIV